MVTITQPWAAQLTKAAGGTVDTADQSCVPGKIAKLANLPQPKPHNENSWLQAQCSTDN